MDAFNVLFFNGLDSYEVKSVKNDEFQNVAYDYLSNENSRRGFSKTDPWMNRSSILADPEDDKKKYILIPSHFSDKNDIAVTTVGKFIIFCADDKDVLSLTDCDVKFVISELPKLFSSEKRAEAARKHEEEWQSCIICSTYRYMLNEMSVKNALFLRSLFLNFRSEYLLLFRALTDSSFSLSCSDIYKRHCAGASDQDAETFSRELLKAFLSFDEPTGLLFLMATQDKTYEDAFLRASQKEWLETFKSIPQFLNA